MTHAIEAIKDRKSCTLFGGWNYNVSEVVARWVGPTAQLGPIPEGYEGGVEGWPSVHAWLESLDYDVAQMIHPNHSSRIEGP